jgi:hypothetical protein
MLLSNTQNTKDTKYALSQTTIGQKRKVPKGHTVLAIAEPVVENSRALVVVGHGKGVDEKANNLSLDSNKNKGFSFKIDGP